MYSPVEDTSKCHMIPSYMYIIKENIDWRKHEMLWLSFILWCWLKIVTAVSVIQKLPEIARATTTSPQVMAFYEHLTSKRYVWYENKWISFCEMITNLLLCVMQCVWLVYQTPVMQSYDINFSALSMQFTEGKHLWNCACCWLTWTCLELFKTSDWWTVGHSSKASW